MPKKKATTSLVDQRLVEASAARTLFTQLYLHTILAQTCLPYRDPEDAKTWERRNGQVFINVYTRPVLDPETKKWDLLGLPYGPKARLILAHLTTEALITGNPDVETEDTLTRFTRKALGMDTNGRTLRMVKEQLTRLAACQIGLGMIQERKAIQIHEPYVSKFDLWCERKEGERVLWPKVIKFSPAYFDSLQKHAVPLNESHLIGLSHSSMALDIYAWLAQRLHRVKPGVPESITWLSLFDQFGTGYSHVYEFRRVFKAALKQVLTVYHAARIELTKNGLQLFHSQPPVPKKLITGPWKNL